ncbi:MAG: hypothetical protein AAF702_35540 [Chloroflexota bacterium]
MSEPPKADIVILRQDEPSWTSEQLQFLPDGIRDVQASHVLIEFKYTESLNEIGLRQTVGYDHFYGQYKVPRRDLQSFVISSITPEKKFFDTFGYKETEVEGVYQSPFPLLNRIPLILLNELADKPYNAFVQCFASHRKIRQRAFRRLKDRDWGVVSEEAWAFVYGLQNQMAQRGKIMEQVIPDEGITPEMLIDIGMNMRKGLLPHLSIEERLTGVDLGELLAAIDPEMYLSKIDSKEILARLEPEERLAGLEPEERLAGLEPEERLAGLEPEERLAGLEPEERLAGLEPEERLAGLEPEERLAGLEPEERLAGLEPEEIERLKAFLATFPNTQNDSNNQ